QSGGYVAAPLVVARDAVGVGRLDGGEQVRAQHIAAVVCLAESLELTVGQFDRLEFCEQVVSGLRSPNLAFSQLITPSLDLRLLDPQFFLLGSPVLFGSKLLLLGAQLRLARADLLTLNLDLLAVALKFLPLASQDERPGGQAAQAQRQNHRQ